MSPKSSVTSGWHPLGLSSLIHPNSSCLTGMCSGQRKRKQSEEHGTDSTNVIISCCYHQVQSQHLESRGTQGERLPPSLGRGGQGGLLEVGTQLHLEEQVKSQPGKSKFIRKLLWSEDLGKRSEQESRGLCFLVSHSGPGPANLS